MPTVIVRMKTKYVSEKVIVLLADQQIIYNSTLNVSAVKHLLTQKLLKNATMNFNLKKTHKEFLICKVQSGLYVGLIKHDSIASVLSLCRVYWRDGQRCVVLSTFISAGAEEWVDAFTECVIKGVDVDFSINIVERYLQNHKDGILLKKTEYKYTQRFGYLQYSARQQAK